MLSRTQSILIVALLSLQHLCAYEFTLKSLKKQADYLVAAAKERQYTIAGGLVGGAALSYLIYAFYLDKQLADQESWWQWALSHLREGTVESDELILQSQERHPELLAVHPLSVVFAADHEIREEINSCLTLRGMLQTLAGFKLDWVYRETIASLDKKLEALYLLKVTLASCTTEIRSRCKKQAMRQLM